MVRDQPWSRSVQVRAALDKQRNPQNYCRHRRCLWKIIKGDKTYDPCRRHPGLSMDYRYEVARALANLDSSTV